MPMTGSAVQAGDGGSSVLMWRSSRHASRVFGIPVRRTALWNIVTHWLSGRVAASTASASCSNMLVPSQIGITSASGTVDAIAAPNGPMRLSDAGITSAEAHLTGTRVVMQCHARTPHHPTGIGRSFDVATIRQDDVLKAAHEFTVGDFGIRSDTRHGAFEDEVAEHPPGREPRKLIVLEDIVEFPVSRS